MKIKKILLLLFLICTNSVHAAEIKDDNDAILQLGMEMSNMRNMLEAYILVGIKLDYKNPKAKLQNGISHYENLLKALQSKYVTDTEMQTSIQTSFKAWKIVRQAMSFPLKKNISLQKMKKGAIFIHGNIRTVIKEMEHMKRHLLTLSSFKDKEALNASIEVAASARRLSAHYMMELWKLDDPTIKKHWNKGLKIYGDALVTLRQSRYMNNHKFKKLFNSCSKYHRYFTRMGDKPKIFSILIDKKARIAFKKAKEMTSIILESNTP